MFWRPKSLSKCGAFLVQHMLHQIKAPPFYTNFLKLISLVMDSSISEVEFLMCKSVFFLSFSP